MGNNSSQTSKKQGSSLIITRMIDSKSSKTKSLPSIPLSLGAASLSCLAAEHHQIHDQQSLDAWRTKALHTIDELYEQKTLDLKHDAHLNALLGQLKAIIDEEKSCRGNGYFIDDHPIQMAPDGFRE